jgi:G3E family GTPase
VIRTTLVWGARPSAREAAIAAALDAHDPLEGPAAVILEGIPDGSSNFDLNDARNIHVVRIAPGCICCGGNLTMRVTLDRVLRRRPQRLYIGLANADHLLQIRHFLQRPPYDTLLSLTDDVRA